ncbi:NmrA/HSCARG family protein [Acetobacter okinawensis]|uniref:NmrA family transcriptional regulator n=1 Tax=Novacetimonas pomaceti TaxID=2021998 RepID=A0ABX5P497_9PROT|nr:MULTISPECIES: NmrA/HSCARG family protein [Acetobacteraceae]MBS0966475.1 NmrA/HSCARG family protein [Acetobacter okinawensis]PYD48602.1 NmrA family transcriptional regulator [Novacetimonas pomaceti]
MTILVTGATGRIGSLVVERLAGKGVTVKALARNPDKLRAPADVIPVKGDMTDIASMKKALEGVDTLFLINAVIPDEVTQALLTLDLAREAGIQRIVYFSVFNSALGVDVPHFAGKFLVERVIDSFAIPATVLRPAYFMQNDTALLDAIKQGVYPQPVGQRGVAMVDERDVADAAAAELLRRERSAHPLPRNTIELVGPDTLTGDDLARLWTDVLGRQVQYGGDDLAAFEQQTAQFLPAWQARDLRIMLRSFHSYGMVPAADVRPTLEALIGHPLRSYRDFAREITQG